MFKTLTFLALMAASLAFYASGISADEQLVVEETPAAQVEEEQGWLDTVREKWDNFKAAVAKKYHENMESSDDEVDDDSVEEPESDELPAEPVDEDLIVEIENPKQ